MPQSPLAAAVGKTPANALVPLATDSLSQALISPSSTINVIDGSVPLATKSALYVTAASVIKASAGTLIKVSVLAVSTTVSALTINDCAVASLASTANQILVAPANSFTAGQIFTVEWPCLVGITVSSVGTGGVFSISYV